MKSKKKLNLDDLKVDSFVTHMEYSDAKTVKGGTSSVQCSVAGAILVGALAYYMFSTEIPRINNN